MGQQGDGIVSKYPKTVAAAGRESKGLKDLAAALWMEIPPGKRGGSEDRSAEVRPALEEAQAELATEGFVYSFSRLQKVRQVAGWVAGGEQIVDINSLPWRDVPYSVHEEAYNDGFSLKRLDGLIAEDEKVTVDTIRGLVGKKQTRPPKTTTEQEFAGQSHEENREAIAAIKATPEGRKALREELAEDEIFVKDINRRRSVLDQAEGKKPKKDKKDKKEKPGLDDWELWDEDQRADFDKKVVDSVRHVLNAQLLRQRGYEMSADAAMHLELIRPSDLDAEVEALLREVQG